MSSHIDQSQVDSADPPGFDHELDLAARLSAAARSFFTPRSVEQTLQTVTTTAADMVAGTDCADVLIISKKMFRSHARTGDILFRTETFQEQFGESPCADAARGEIVVLSSDLTVDLRWPEFGAAAADAGIRSALSLALFVGDTVLGALNLFGTAADAFTPDDVALATQLATHAGIALYAATEQEHFSAALASRDMLGQAKGMLMERYAIGDVQAFALLAKLSQENQTPVAEIAAELIVLGSDTRAGPQASEGAAAPPVQ